MSTVNEEISRYNSNSAGKTDANLANDSLHLGGVPAEDYSTKAYMETYVTNIKNLLKTYIDTQDVSVLQEAKAYTDLMINSQDFSAFAKLTDLEAVRTALLAEISRVETEQKQYTDNKISALSGSTSNSIANLNSSITNLSNSVNNRFNQVNGNISNINNDLTGVHTSINNLEQTTSELFTSVSNGKTSIAGAITDKGVATSANATFSEMATNIRNIPQSGGGTDTSDATAIASDILQGKTAYARGSKIYGTLIAANSHEDNPDNPYPVRDEVELVYATIPGEMSKLETVNSITSDLFTITGTRNFMAKYIANEAKIQLLEYDNGVYVKKHHYKINGQTGVVEEDFYTPDYTLEQLGITLNNDLEISDIKFSAMNQNDDESGYYCMFAIAVRRKTSTINETIKSHYIYVYKFDTSNKQYPIFLENETLATNYKLVNKHIIESVSTSVNSYCNIVFHPTNMRKFLIHESIEKATLKSTELMKYASQIEIDNKYTYIDLCKIETINRGSSAMPNYAFMENVKYLNDRLITYDEGNGIEGSPTPYTRVCILNESGGLQNRGAIDCRTALTSDGLYAFKYDGKFYQVFINYTTGSISMSAITDVAVVNTDLLKATYYTYGNGIQPFYFDDSGKYLIVYNLEKAKTYVFYIDSFDQITSLLDLYTFSSLNSSTNLSTVISGFSEFVVNSSGFINIVYPSENREEVAGIKYQGTIYYPTVYDSHILSAKQEDVVYGKTFIGYDGIPQVGTKSSGGNENE